jgi:uncharacterized integral membrane protein
MLYAVTDFIINPWLWIEHVRERRIEMSWIIIIILIMMMMIIIIITLINFSAGSVNIYHGKWHLLNT